MSFIFHLVQGTRLQGVRRLECGLGSKEQGSLNFFLVFCCFVTKEPIASACCSLPILWGEVRRGERDTGGGAQKSLAALEVWWLAVATQDGDLVLALPGWPPGCFLVASRARSQAIMLLEA